MMDLQLITQELLDAGARRAGAYTRRQIELQDLEWPPRKGWKTDVIGKSIMKSDAKEFVELGGANAPAKRKGHQPDRFWCGASNPGDIYLYVLELTGGNYYVGLSKGVNGRYQDHLDGKEAVWAKQYPRGVTPALRWHDAGRRFTMVIRPLLKGLPFRSREGHCSPSCQAASRSQ